MICQHDTPNPTEPKGTASSLCICVPIATTTPCCLLPPACPWELLQWKRGDPVIGLQYSLTAGHCLLLRQLQCLCSGPSSVESKAGVTHVQPRHHRCVSRNRIRASIMQQQQQPGLEGAVMKPSEPAEDEQQQEEAERRRLYQAWKGNNVSTSFFCLLLSFVTSFKWFGNSSNKGCPKQTQSPLTGQPNQPNSADIPVRRAAHVRARRLVPPAHDVPHRRPDHRLLLPDKIHVLRLWWAAAAADAPGSSNRSHRHNDHGQCVYLLGPPSSLPTPLSSLPAIIMNSTTAPA